MNKAELIAKISEESKLLLGDYVENGKKQE